jgi:hypothetical protein
VPVSPIFFFGAAAADARSRHQIKLPKPNDRSNLELENRTAYTLCCWKFSRGSWFIKLLIAAFPTFLGLALEHSEGDCCQRGAMGLSPIGGWDAAPRACIPCVTCLVGIGIGTGVSTCRIPCDGLQDPVFRLFDLRTAKGTH